MFYKDPPGEDWPQEWRDLVVSCTAFLPKDRPLLSDIVTLLNSWQDREDRAC